MRDSEKKYRSLFENMTEMFQIIEPILDEQGKCVDFRYVEVNKASEVFSGMKRDAMQGKSARELWPKPPFAVWGDVTQP